MVSAKIFRPILALTVFFTGAWAEAGAYIKPQVMYLIDGEEENGTTTTTTRQLIDLGAGYLTTDGIAIGGLYATEKTQIKTEGASSSVTDKSRTSLGGGLGYFMQGNVAPYIMADYLFSSEYIESSTTYTGTGYLVDLGVRFSVGSLFLGMQLTYKKFEYKESRSGSTTTSLSQPLKHTFLDPYFAFMFQF